MDIKVNFSGRAIRYTEEEIAVVVEAMRNADPLTQGHHMRRFESAFAEYQRVAQGTCFTTMNGCAALELSAQLCLFNEGDEVVIPSHTFTASAYPYIKKGARLVWADVDMHSRVVTADSIEKVLSPRTKAVVVVHLYGYVADMPAITALCKERGLILIEDAAQAIGAEVDGIKAGAFGDMAIFSFHSHKNMTTLGEGGMLYVRDPKLAGMVPTLRHNYHLLAARMTTGVEARDRFMRAMFNDKGVKCVVQYIPLDRYDYYRRLGMGEACCPNADTFFDSMISFPFQHWLTAEEFDYMLACTREVLAQIR